MGTGGGGVMDWKLKSLSVQEFKRNRADSAEALSAQMFAEKKVDVSVGCEAVNWLPRSLRSVAGPPRTARKKKQATPVGMTAKKNQENPKSTAPSALLRANRNGCATCWA